MCMHARATHVRTHMRSMHMHMHMDMHMHMGMRMRMRMRMPCIYKRVACSLEAPSKSTAMRLSAARGCAKLCRKRCSSGPTPWRSPPSDEGCCSVDVAMSTRA
jgi:hypothetical protein